MTAGAVTLREEVTHTYPSACQSCSSGLGPFSLTTLLGFGAFSIWSPFPATSLSASSIGGVLGSLVGSCFVPSRLFPFAPLYRACDDCCKRLDDEHEVERLLVPASGDLSNREKVARIVQGVVGTVLFVSGVGIFCFAGADVSKFNIASALIGMGAGGLYIYGSVDRFICSSSSGS